MGKTENIYSKIYNTKTNSTQSVCVFDGGENELATEMELNGKLNEMNG